MSQSASGPPFCPGAGSPSELQASPGLRAPGDTPSLVPHVPVHWSPDTFSPTCVCVSGCQRLDAASRASCWQGRHLTEERHSGKCLFLSSQGVENLKTDVPGCGLHTTQWASVPFASTGNSSGGSNGFMSYEGTLLCPPLRKTECLRDSEMLLRHSAQRHDVIQPTMSVTVASRQASPLSDLWTWTSTREASE